MMMLVVERKTKKEEMVLRRVFLPRRNSRNFIGCSTGFTPTVPCTFVRHISGNHETYDIYKLEEGWKIKP